MAGRTTLVVCHNRGGVVLLPLVWERDEFVLGRDAECHVRLADAKVSPRHARLTRDPLSGELWVTALESEGGTTLDGRRLEPGQPTPLAWGAVVRIGDTTLVPIERAAPWLPHRALTPETFARRVDDAVARASADGSTFALVEIGVSEEGRRAACDMSLVLHALMKRAFHADDGVVVLGVGGPSALGRVIVPRASRAGVRSLLERLRPPTNAPWQFSARWAFFPRDGVTGASLEGALEAVEFGERPIMHRRVPTFGRSGEPGAAFEQVASGDENVLLVGGAGLYREAHAGLFEEAYARLLHERSPRAGRPFVRVDCSDRGAMYELFGYEAGAAPGGPRVYPGALETVEGGTVFLENVDERSQNVQYHLARAIGAREFVRIGSRKVRPVRARVIASTRSTPAAGAGPRPSWPALLPEFVEGLRICALPPFECGGELRELVEPWLEGAVDEAGRPAPRRLSARALMVLEAYRWRSTSRELYAVIEGALARCDGPIVEFEHLPLEHFCDAISTLASLRPEHRLVRGGGRQYTAAEERARLERILTWYSGDITLTAARLRAPPETIVALVEKYGLNVPRELTPATSEGDGSFSPFGWCAPRASR